MPNRPPAARHTPPAGLAAQLAALGQLLEGRGYRAEGLCILAVDDGFVVTGLRVPERGAAYSLAQETMEVATAELAALGGRP